MKSLAFLGSSFVIAASIVAVVGVASAEPTDTNKGSVKPNKTLDNQPSAEASWSVVEEEDFWTPLRYEPLLAIDTARMSYRRHEEREAADAIDKTVSWLHLAARHARPVTRTKLLEAATSLKRLSKDMKAGDTSAAAKLEPNLASAAQALGEWNYYKADQWWGKSDERAASRDLEVAARYLQNAADSAHAEFGPDTREVITRLYTNGKLTSETAHYDHNTLATNLKGVEKATKELAHAMKQD